MTNTITLRPAAEADIAAIARIWHRGWRDAHLGHVPDALLRHRQPGDFRRLAPVRLSNTIVAVVASRIIGFVVTRGDEIEQLYVEASGRGTGVADALLNHGEQTIAGAFDRAWLAVVAGNTRARRFYERNGWSDTGPFHYRAAIADGATVPVPVRRYEKQLTVSNRSGPIPDPSCSPVADPAPTSKRMAKDRRSITPERRRPDGGDT